MDNPTKSQDVMDSIKSTNLKKFGVEWAGQNLNIKNKIKETWRLKYKTGHPSGCETVRQKTYDTNIKKYGVPHGFQSSEIIQKIHVKRKEMYIRLAKMTEIEIGIRMIEESR